MAEFPFDCIVVTCPDAAAAETARKGPLLELEHALNAHKNSSDQDATRIRKRPVTIVATSDPFGSRCGSGGGTLAALEAVEMELLQRERHHGEEPQGVDPLAKLITLVLHAGGESSRCPTQMIHGKAWASLPLQQHQQKEIHDQSHDKSYGLILNSTRSSSNPTVLLIDQLARLFHVLMHTERHIVLPGTVVVAATDTLLQLLECDSDGRMFGKSTTMHLNHQALPSQSTEVDERAAVIGVAVPADLAISKNHGVYDLGNPFTDSQRQQHSPKIDQEKSRNQTSSSTKTYMLVPPKRVLQKPSLDVLRNDKSIHFDRDIFGGIDDDNYRSYEHEDDLDHKYNAWIDTGIVIFLPSARLALRRLSFGILAKCTTRGLIQAYRDSLKQKEVLQEEPHGTHLSKKIKYDLNNSSGDHASYDEELKTYARGAALKVDLYTDLLHSFSFGSEASESTDSDMLPLQRYLRDSLCHLKLLVLAIPRGKFLHLGTTQEWVDFLVENAADHDQRVKGQGNSNGLSGRLNLPCVTRHSCWIRVAAIGNIATDAIIYNSVLEPAKTLNIGNGSIVEHCMFSSVTNDDILIGSNCLLSGLRPGNSFIDHCFAASHAPKNNSKLCPPHAFEAINAPTSAGSGPLIFPNNMCVQQVALKHNGNCVYMVVGMKDDIKLSPCKTLYNIPLDQVLRVILGEGSDCADEDTNGDVLWPSTKNGRSIWNAKIHPIVEDGTPFQSVFLWLIHKLQPECYDFDMKDVAESLNLWRSLPRASLKDLHGLADAARDWEFRRDLLRYTTETRRSVFRHHWKTYWGMKTGPISSTKPDDCNVGSTSTQGDSVSSCAVQNEAGAMDWAWLRDLSRYDNREAHKEMCDMLETLHQVVTRAFASLDHYPICARALMVASALVADVANFWLLPTFEKAQESSALESLKKDLGANMRLIESMDDLESDLHQHQVHAFRNILVTVEKGIKHDLEVEADDSVSVLVTCSEVYEQLARFVTERCVVGGRLRQLCSSRSKKGRISSDSTMPTNAPILDHWVISTAPGRIDLSGGWSDTPPICFSEFGGSVTGLAVKIDGKFAVSCRCRIVPGEKSILLRSELRGDIETSGVRDDISDSHRLVSCREMVVQDAAVLSDFRDPLSDCALLKCALVCLGLSSARNVESKDKSPFQSDINRFCGNAEDENVRLEIISASLLPQGSGMGTSSILAGCVLAAVAKAIGRSDMEDPNNLTYSVLMLEQLLTAGGGYQDQVNGLVGGLKTVSSKSNRLPLEVSVQRVEIPSAVKMELNERLVLAFTGKTRLAKNILQKVLRRWARRTPDIVQTVENLLFGAQSARTAVQTGNLDLLGECLNIYWKHKKIMAGEESGAEPSAVRDIIAALLERQAIVGASLCGAGGGGFLVLLASKGMNKEKIQELVQKELVPQQKEFAEFRWHECTICDEGLTTRVLEQRLSVDAFDIALHMSSDPTFVK